MGAAPTNKSSFDWGILGRRNYRTGEATGLGAVEKWVAGWSPLAPDAAKKAAGVDHEAWMAQQRLEGERAKADRQAVDLSDQQARQVAEAARRRQGRGLSSTFVSGQGVSGRSSLLGG